MENFNLIKKTHRTIFLGIVLTISIFSLHSQNPSIEWQKCMGGTEDDKGHSIIQTIDGGFISVGLTRSTDFDLIGNLSSSWSDLFVVKFSSNGIVEWEKYIGGTGGEYDPSIIETYDGNYLISAETFSNDEDVSGNHDPNCSTTWKTDAWIVKLDNLGNIIWQKCYGGSDFDAGQALIQTYDGGFVFAGYTMSVDGDLANINFYENSFQGWIVKIDTIGTIQWQKLIGGLGEDFLYSIQLTSDSGFIVAGVTSSHDGDVIGNNGVESAWVVKLSNTGSIQWQKCIGSGNYSKATDVKQCSDGGYIVACEKMVPVGTEMGYSHGYVIKLTSSGNVEWEKQLGGNRDDFLNSIQETVDGGFIVGGSTYSWDGDLQGTPYLGYLDYWIIKLSSIGNIEWQRRFGGNNNDRLLSIQQTSDLGYILAGETKSMDHDVVGIHNNGSSTYYYDMWIVKISPTVKIENFNDDNLIQIYPNPTNSILNIDVPSDFLNQQYQIVTIFGQIINADIISKEHNQLNVNHLPKGIYFLQIGNRSKKFVVN
jgi:hypothetical protein